MILRVLELTLADEGEYKCVVTNERGAKVFIFELDVLRKCLVILNLILSIAIFFNLMKSKIHFIIVKNCVSKSDL